MANSIKDLYLSENLSELQMLAAPRQLKNADAKLLINTASKLYSEAEKGFAAGDEELAYFYYFRYADAISVARHKKDYQKEYNKLISRSNLKNAIEKLEQLTDSLTRRYKLRDDAKNLTFDETNQEFTESNTAEEMGFVIVANTASSSTPPPIHNDLDETTNTTQAEQVNVLSEFKNLLEEKIRARLPNLHDNTASQMNPSTTNEDLQHEDIVSHYVPEETSQVAASVDTQVGINEGTVGADYQEHEEITKTTDLKCDRSKLNEICDTKVVNADDYEVGYVHGQFRGYSCFECPICFEIPRNKKIFQCRNGHMICEECCELVTTCPQCNAGLTCEDRIRNRAMEDVLQTIKM